MTAETAHVLLAERMRPPRLNGRLNGQALGTSDLLEGFQDNLDSLSRK
jgi:hypothetical protein